MNKIERILEIVSNQRMTYSDFSQKIGIKKQMFSNWKNFSQEIADKHLIRIIKEFPEVDARWLITGEKGVSEKEREEFETKKEEFEKSYKDTIKLLQASIADKERIIAMKDEINADLREMLKGK